MFLWLSTLSISACLKSKETIRCKHNTAFGFSKSQTSQIDLCCIQYSKAEGLPPQNYAHMKLFSHKLHSSLILFSSRESKQVFYTRHSTDKLVCDYTVAFQSCPNHRNWCSDIYSLCIIHSSYLSSTGCPHPDVL